MGALGVLVSHIPLEKACWSTTLAMSCGGSGPHTRPKPRAEWLRNKSFRAKCFCSFYLQETEVTSPTNQFCGLQMSSLSSPGLSEVS